MNARDQIEAIAIADGMSKNPDGTWTSPDRGTVNEPDYLGNRDAINAVLQRMKYRDLVGVDDILRDVILKHEMLNMATPVQWCEAFLRFKKLWNITT